MTRRLLHQPLHLAHGPRAADEVRAFDLGFAQRQRLHRAPQTVAEGDEIERLGQVIEQPLAREIHRVGQVGHPGEHDRRRVDALFAQLEKKPAARAVRQPLVENHQVERPVLDRLACAVDAVADDGAPALLLHRQRDQLRAVQIILQNQAGEPRGLGSFGFAHVTISDHRQSWLVHS